MVHNSQLMSHGQDRSPPQARAQARRRRREGGGVSGPGTGPSPSHSAWATNHEPWTKLMGPLIPKIIWFEFTPTRGLGVCMDVPRVVEEHDQID